MFATRWTTASLVTAGLCLASPAGAGQSAGETTGAIEGTVTDPTGAPLQHVAVRASGAPLMKPVEVLSGAEGHYRIPLLHPGEYEVTFTLNLFSTNARPARVSAGTVTRLSVTLDVTLPSDVVTVDGSARTLSPRGTTLSAIFDEHDLARLPGSRTVAATLAASAGMYATRAAVGSSQAVAPAPLGAYGTSAFQRPTIDGTSVAGMHQIGFSPDYGSFQHVRVGLGAYGPEWPSPGVHAQIITKSGGDRYRGTLYAGYGRAGWQAHNIDAGQADPTVDAAAARAANRQQGDHDLNGDIGGFLLPQRAWWYASLRDHRAAVSRMTYPFAPIETRVRSVTAKGTVRLSNAMRLDLSGQRAVQRQPTKLDAALLSAGTARHVTPLSTLDQRAEGTVWSAEWTATRGDTLLLSGHTGGFVAARTEHPKSAAPRIEDRGTFEVTGGGRHWQTGRSSIQAGGTMVHMGGGRLSGHLLKVGGEARRIVDAETWFQGYPGDVLHVRHNGVAQEVYLYQTPSRSESGQWWFTAFAGDSWRLHDRLTAELGVRFDRFRIFLPPQAHRATTFDPVPALAAWNTVVPRLGVIFDLTGDDRTLLRMTYGRYRLTPSTALGFNLNPNAPAWFVRYRWADDDGDGVWDPGEEKEEVERRDGSALPMLDPALQLPIVYERTARIEREVTETFSVRTGVVHRHDRQQGVQQRATWTFEDFTVAAPRIDPGPDGRLGTADDGGIVLLSDLPLGLAGASAVIVRNVADADSDAFSWDIAAHRRFSGRWSLSADYVHTWHRTQASGFLGQAVRNNVLPLTPNDLLHTDDGRHVFSTWAAKAIATYGGPWNTIATAFVRHQSGQPFGRTFLAQPPLNQGSVRVLAEPVGTRRQDHVTVVDIQIGKAVRLPRVGRMTTMVEVFNLLNANPEEEVVWSSGPTFLRPLAVLPPRVARVSLRVDW
jgi:hypothetical protein